MSTNLTAVLQQILQNTTNLKVLRELKHEIPERVGGSRQLVGPSMPLLETQITQSSSTNKEPCHEQWQCGRCS